MRNLNININGAKKGLATPPIPTLGTPTVISDTQINIPVTSSYPYEMWYSDDSGATYTKHGDGSATPYEATGLTAGTLYYFEARAKNGSKYSDYSGAVSVSTQIPFQSDLLLQYDGTIIQKTDGYYFEDKINDNDGKIINNNCLRFTDANKTYCNLTSIATGVNCVGGETNIYETILKFDSLDTSGAEKYIYNGGSYVASKGVSFLQVDNKLRLNIYNGATSQTITSTMAIPDTNFHYFKFAVNLSAMNVMFQIDSNSETQNITLVGGTYGHTGTTLIGSNAAPIQGDMVYFKITKNGSVVLYLAFQTEASGDLYNLATGLSIASCLVVGTATTQDYYPHNILHGFELYKKDSDGTLKYIPARLDGTFISPTITGYTKFKEYPAGAGFNYSESSIYVNESLTITQTSLLTFPFIKSVCKTTGYLFTSILYYNTDLTESNLRIVLTYLGYSYPRTIINIGDSIACGGGFPLVSELPAYLLPDQPNAKIYNLATSTVQTLTKDNSDQIAYVGSFSPLLSFAYNYGLELWLMGKADGGTTLYTDWKTSPEASRLTDLKNSVRNSFKDMLANYKYPIFEIYSSLGHNDASLGGDAVINFGLNLETLINNLKSFVNQSSEFHIIRPRKGDANRISVANQIDSLTSLVNKIYAYDPEDISSYEPDSVHPDTTGCIELGIMFESKQYDKP